VRLSTSGVGLTLRQERLRQGLSLEAISTQTRISQRFLRSIEAGDLASLPGILFARNFVRQFAVLLGMDPVPLLESLPKAVIEDLPLPDAAQFSRRRVPNIRWSAALSTFLWIVLAAGTAAGAYVYFNQNHAVNQPPAVVNRPPVTQTTPVAPPIISSESPVSPAVGPDTASQPVQVVLKARQASWVQVLADGRNAFTGILQANDSRSVAANALVKVTAGNAGGIEISLNGKPLEPLGPSGQVRTIRLTAEGPQLVVKTSQTTSAPL
jgi:cytoskeletal protein RodZ